MFETGIEAQIDFRILRSPDLHRIHPSGITDNRLRAFDFLNHQAIVNSQSQSRLEHFLTATDQNCLALSGPIFFERRIYQIALRLGEHEIALLNADRQSFLETFVEYAVWQSPLD